MTYKKFDWSPQKLTDERVDELIRAIQRNYREWNLTHKYEHLVDLFSTVNLFFNFYYKSVATDEDEIHKINKRLDEYGNRIFSLKVEENRVRIPNEIPLFLFSLTSEMIKGLQDQRYFFQASDAPLSLKKVVSIFEEKEKEENGESNK